MSDYDQYVAPLAGDKPSGPNLEYDPRFQQFERLLQGKPEQAIGDKVVPAEAPDWQQVCSEAQSLLALSRDLRIAVPLCVALLRTQGFNGLADGLVLVRGLLDQQWPSVHPQLDAEDHDDPTSRLNSLLALAAPDSMLKAVRETPVVHSRTLGRFSLRDLRLAAGKVKPAAGDKEPAQAVQIEAAFQDCELDDLRKCAASVAMALEQLAAIDRLLIDKTGAAAPDLKPLSVDLAELNGVLKDRLAARTGGSSGPGDTLEGPPGAGGVPGALRTREDVVRALERICDYYRRHEPSSPIPLLLERAKRLVAKDFLEIIRDLTPGGVSDAELIAGVEKK
jgi:type VI secretion system protein ImpA